MLLLLTHLLDPGVILLNACLPTLLLEVAKQSKSTNATKYTRFSRLDWPSGMIVLEGTSAVV
jgi:hypothetical protein